MFLSLLPFRPGSLYSGFARLLVSPKVTGVPCISFQYEDRHAKWDINQAGFSHSHQHGFGLLNAWRLVNAAKVIPLPVPGVPHGQVEPTQPSGGDRSCTGNAVG